MTPVDCEMYAYISFYGEFEPQQLRDVLDPKNTDIAIRRKGEQNRYTRTPEIYDSLKIKTRKRRTYDLEELLDELRQVSPDWQAAGAWAKAHGLDVFFRVVATIGETAPALVMRPEHLAWLLDLNATVDMDLYVSNYVVSDAVLQARMTAVYANEDFSLSPEWEALSDEALRHSFADNNADTD